MGGILAPPGQDTTKYNFGDPRYGNNQPKNTSGSKGKGFMDAAHPNTSNPLGGQSWSGNTSYTGFNGPAVPAFSNLLKGMESSSGFDPAKAGQQAQDKMYAALQSRLDPAWQNRQQAFDAQLANQGLTPGSEAYTNASRNFGQQRNDAYSQAAGQAIGLGQQEQSQARANSMLPFGEAGAMMGMLGQQGNNLGSGLQAANMQAGANQASSNASQNKKGSSLGGIAQIAGLFLDE